MKNILLFSILILGFNLAFSQQDPEAKKILDKLSEETKSHKSISTDFKVTFKNIKENIQNSSEGNIIIKGDKYRLRFMETEAFFDGKTLYNYIPEVNEVNITEPEPNDEDIFNNPKRLFTIYENDYKYQLISNITEEGKNHALIDLYPADLEEEFSRIRLEVNTEVYHLISATIFGKDGSHYTISINNYKTNLNFDDNYFVFNDKNYPNTEIIDMR
ncbi:outer membrane lipoprotein carrier protein LolA [Bacteroidota bacterium]